MHFGLRGLPRQEPLPTEVLARGEGGAGHSLAGAVVEPESHSIEHLEVLTACTDIWLEKQRSWDGGSNWRSLQIFEEELQNAELCHRLDRYHVRSSNPTHPNA